MILSLKAERCSSHYWTWSLQSLLSQVLPNTAVFPEQELRCVNSRSSRGCMPQAIVTPFWFSFQGVSPGQIDPNHFRQNRTRISINTLHFVLSKKDWVVRGNWNLLDSCSQPFILLVNITPDTDFCRNIQLLWPFCASE